MSCNMSYDSSRGSCNQVPVTDSSTIMCSKTSHTQERVLHGAPRHNKQPSTCSSVFHDALTSAATPLQQCCGLAGTACLLLGQHARPGTDDVSSKHRVPFFARRAVESTPVCQHTGKLRLIKQLKPLPCAILVYTASQNRKMASALRVFPSTPGHQLSYKLPRPIRKHRLPRQIRNAAPQPENAFAKNSHIVQNAIHQKNCVT